MNKKSASPQILFIADGGMHCGMGHIVRSLSLAAALKDNGCNVQFLSRYQEGIDAIRRSGYFVYEQEDIYSAILHASPHIIIVDTYNVSHEFFIDLRKYAPIVYIDDLYAFEYPVDVILNGNITGSDMGYRMVLNEQKHLLGMDYNLIRNEFKNIPMRIINDTVTHVMITTGASDPFNMTGRILNYILNDAFLKTLQYNIVIGPAFEHHKEILQFANNYENIHCFINTLKMSEIMLSSDIAISAGGSTLYELAACGTPTIAFIYAENQRKVVEKMADEYLLNIGYYEEIDYHNLILCMKSIINNKTYRYNVSKKMQTLVDGKGAERAADKILYYCFDR